MNKFASRLRHALHIRHMSQSELARRCGLEKSTVTQWVKGRNQTSIGTLYKVSCVLNVSIDWLIGLVDDEPRLEVPHGSH
ncbi:MAG: helix-turn-helix transcriptional regulator [Oscillospiraceae bacterium]|nr:helix-turn-helix transcriptional regulator [Oscillospiraceae bacterium]